MCVALSQPAMPPVATKPVSRKKSDMDDLFDKTGGEEEEDNVFGAPSTKVSRAAIFTFRFSMSPSKTK